MSSVPRHSEEELRQQWAFLDALVDRQAASLKSGIQDPEEDDAVVAMAAPDPNYLEEISTLTQRVTTLEGERTTLLRRIDLSEEARMAAETAREAAESARVTAERNLAQERSRLQPRLQPWPQVAAEPNPVAPVGPAREAAPVIPPAVAHPADTPAETQPVAIPAKAAAEPVAIPAAPVAQPDAIPAAPAAQPVVIPPKAAPEAGAAPQVAAPKGRRKSWWQRIRE